MTGSVAEPNKDKTYKIILWLFILAYIGGFSCFTITRHQYLNSTTFDLGIQDQVVWNTAQGRPFASSIEVENFLGDHVAFILMLISPLYWIWSDVKILLILQTVALALGALPIFCIARKELESNPAGIVFAVAYLAYPALGFMNRFDFHALTFATPLLLYAFYFIWRGRLWWATVFILLCVFTREEMGLTVFMLGLYAAVAMKKRKCGIAWACFALGWAAFAMLYLIPYFRGGASGSLERYSYLEGSPKDILENLLLNPVGTLWQSLNMHPTRKVWYLVQLLLPLSFTPLLKPGLLVIILPALVLSLLSNMIEQSSIYFQYVAPMIPFLFIAGIFGVRDLFDDRGIWAFLMRHSQAKINNWASDKQRLFLALLILATTVMGILLDNPILKTIDRPYYRVRGIEQRAEEVYQEFEKVSKMVAPAGSLSVMNHLGPHFSHREKLQMLPGGEQKGIEQMLIQFDEIEELSAPERAMVKLSVIRALHSGQFGIRHYGNGFLLIERGIPLNQEELTRLLQAFECYPWNEAMKQKLVAPFLRMQKRRERR